jgi:ankyrin repeat protein
MSPRKSRFRIALKCISYLCKDMIETLIKAGSFIDASNKDQETPLLVAIDSRYSKELNNHNGPVDRTSDFSATIKLLVHNGANLEIEGKSGKTALIRWDSFLSYWLNDFS